MAEIFVIFQLETIPRQAASQDIAQSTTKTVAGRYDPAGNDRPSPDQLTDRLNQVTH